MKRLVYLDYAKGFAILLMLFDHTKPEKLIDDWVFSFHMPIFFIIAGMLQYYRNAGSITLHNFGNILKRRTLQLGIPYIFFSVFFWLVIFLS